VEQERAEQISEIRAKFDDSYIQANTKVKDGLQRLGDRWEELRSAELPLQFQEDLDRIRQEMGEVVNNKLAFIKELEEEVLKRDHEYVDKNAERNRTVDAFVHQMRQQEADLRESIASELSKSLSAYEQERSTTIIQIQKEVKQLAAKRQERETGLMKQTEQNAIDQRDKLEELRRGFAQEYLMIRTSFETRLEAAQREYEDRLAQFTFSREQLDYDYRILQENEEEHQEKIKMQAKKMVRQRDCLRALKRKYAEDDARFERQNAEITKEYKRIAQSYRELQLRFRNVAYTDFNAFREIWNLSERRLHEMVVKILEADRVVTEQQLGKEPRPVDPEFLRRWIMGTEEFEDLTKTPQSPVAAAKTEPKPNVLNSGVLSEPLEHLRRMVTNEVGFLVDERVKSIIGMDDETIETDRKSVV
jgi:dynein regulatory complex protein 1